MEQGTGSTRWFTRGRARALAVVLALVVGVPAASADHGSDPVGGQPANPSVRCSSSNQQTIDPISPPCVPVYEGDNGGATAPGVTADEIRLLVYLDGGITVNHTDGRANETLPTGELYDLFKTPAENARANGNSETRAETSPVGLLRTYQAYFNQRFQTYKRRVHFYVYFNETNGTNPHAVRAEVDLLRRVVEPFAVIESSDENDHETFATAWAAAGRVVFANYPASRATEARVTPGLVWNHQPSDEQQATRFSSYVCDQVVGRLGPSGPRHLGLLHSGATPGLWSLGQHVQAGVQGCGGTFELVRSNARHAEVLKTTEPPRPEAVLTMAAFREAGVNTVVWAGGFDPEMGRAAAALGYRPEWIIAGDGISETTWAGQQQGGPVFDGAVTVAALLTPQQAASSLCAVTAREVRPTPDEDFVYWCDFYVELRQAFIAFQVAGPTLTAANVDTGLHAIPSRSSTGPAHPASWYDPGDYTCVKDAAVARWDGAAVNLPSTRPGCWRLAEQGLRYSTSWPALGEHPLPAARRDVCSAYAPGIRFNLT